MYEKRKGFVFFLIVFLIGGLLVGCKTSLNKEQGIAEETYLEKRDTNISSQLFFQESMDLQYADQFAIDYYQDGYVLISVADGRKYLIIPKDGKEPEDLEKNIIILKTKEDQIYLVATAVMDMFCELDGLEYIRFSGQKADGWSMEEVKEEMEKGNILYAGKYNAPDYEMITSKGCSLAIENNMISHSPEVIEKLEDFGIPVFVDFSSYESHPLGRVEWIKVYGTLLEKEEEAKKAFDEQMKLMKGVMGKDASGKTVAFFFITTNGMINVRVSSDYVPKMIELAGGKYIFDYLGKEEGSRSSMLMQTEEFYLMAKDADYLIYNSTIDGEIESMEELLEKGDFLKDFKAVQEGKVWCTTKDLYQQSMSIGQLIEDIYNMLSGETDKEKEILYMYKLKGNDYGEKQKKNPLYLCINLPRHRERAFSFL